MRKQKQIIKIDDRQTVNFGTINIELDFMHYLTDERFTYYKKLFRIVRSIGDIQNFSEYNQTLRPFNVESNNKHYILPDKGLSIEELAVFKFTNGMKILSLENVSIIQYNDDILMSEDDIRKIININEAITDSEFEEWEASDERNLLYEILKTKEISIRLRWGNSFIRDVFRRSMKEIKKYDRKDFYRLNKKIVNFILPTDQYSEDEIISSIPQDCQKGNSWIFEFIHGGSCSFILDDIKPRRYGIDFNCYNTIGFSIIYDTETKQLRVVLDEGMIDVVERIGSYDKEVVYERKLKKNLMVRELKDAREEKACLIFLVLCLIGLAMYLIYMVKL